jgi:predicted O-methyltransferase YrrM
MHRVPSQKKMTLITKILSGDKVRISRLHDEKGNFVTWKNLILHVGPAYTSGLLRIFAGYRPQMPWIAYSSIDYLKTFLNKRSRVLEFGSGMSTIWYAEQAGEVFSVENYKPWYDKISKIIESKGISNITYKFTDSESEYSTFMSDDTKGFDLVMVDGSCRSKCVSHASKLVKPGGILYLDNSDKDSVPFGGDMRIAESIARDFAKNSNAEITEITDFAPTQFFVQQGLCVRLPG